MRNTFVILLLEIHFETKLSFTLPVFLQGLKSQSRIKMNIVRCPPVTMVLIRRPDLRYQLGFSVQNGIVSMIDHHNTRHQKPTALTTFMYFFIISTLYLEFHVRKNSKYIQWQ